jgi:hypothetical protein
VARRDHPVWTVYDRLCTARLNVKYYSARLDKYERWNFALEFVLLASAPSSAIAGLWFWNTNTGMLVWQGLSVIAAIAAVLKPLLGLTKRIKDYEISLSGYRGFEYDLMQIRTLIEQKQKYDQSLQNEFRKALEREKTLVIKTPETREDRRLRRECHEEVLRELPPERFFVPEE